LENAARRGGATRIAGLDEVGRGPMFGPVVAAAVILPEGWRLRGLTDSKQLTEEDSAYAFAAAIRAERPWRGPWRPWMWRPSTASTFCRASLLAMRMAVEQLAIVAGLSADRRA
jgi:ribonuclease HII